MPMQNIPNLIKQRNYLQNSIPAMLDLREQLATGVDGIKALQQETQGYHAEEMSQQIGHSESCLQALDAMISSRQKLIIDMEATLKVSRESMLQRDWQSKMPRRDLHLHWHGVDYLAHEEIASRIAVEFTWQCPALLINCHDSDIVETMAGYPQLYLADIDAGRLSKCQERFSLGNINGARTYHIGHEWDDMDLSKLPPNQFGIVIAWYFTEHLSMPYLLDFARKARKVMRPGGRLMFNINDAETSQGAQWAVDGFKHYMTRELITELLREADLNIINCIKTSTSGLMVEAKAPGDLETVKEQPSRFQVKRY